MRVVISVILFFGVWARAPSATGVCSAIFVDPTRSNGTADDVEVDIEIEQYVKVYHPRPSACVCVCV